MKFETTVGSDSKEIDLNSDEGEFTLNGETRSFTFHRQENGRYLLRSGTKVFKIDNVSYDKHTVQFTINGAWTKVDVRDEQDLLLDKLGFKTASEIGEGELNAPMPGKILEMIVKEGDEVSLGDPVAILEAMKMENELKAPIDGIVKTIAVAKNDSVEKNALILEIEASG
ncbi:acetyl-CoA carboxylase biotin carboxyl carrier protein subunit [Balneolaceae bacterium YR4-1]|uniref:Acetyl-CoA carboxylase biotin carboxyl carrier protein subunit n=1 Tax=Halalkalibaculum roseum TaxID=2709311 RepID=A0A6M1T9N8_9BACT|nr:acetyl-CoA carboxylase biotin carboxyl carrier protein subunit [Halalkalibaculum roseum]NGP76933.1 acetyl-CoA carboxylase biotin carboxyl carrier protein subunit [Halalkalibaculum roseum]